jgi:uncharacterized protein YchJ
MEIDNVVWFASHPRPFLVKDDYCADPECSCNAVLLEFLELRRNAREPLPHPLSFSAWIDLDTWQEKNPPERSPEVAAFIQEFLTECPLGRKAEFRASFENSRGRAKRERYVLDPDDVIQGKLISYSDILCEDGALSMGGSGYTYDYEYQGRDFLVEDAYCSDPDCDCQCVRLNFFESVPEFEDEKPVEGVYCRFRAEVTFDGQVQVVELADCTQAEAESVLSSWWEEWQGELPTFQERARQVKEIGRRNLDSRPKRISLAEHPRERSPLPEPWQENDPLFDDTDPLLEGTKVGRNEKCPCGSGKKYKKCCWRKRTPS